MEGQYKAQPAGAGVDVHFVKMCLGNLCTYSFRNAALFCVYVFDVHNKFSLKVLDIDHLALFIVSCACPNFSTGRTEQ